MALQTLKRILFFSVFVSLLLLLPLAFKKATDGFRLAKIQLDYPYVPEWDAEGEAGQILNQPYMTWSSSPGTGMPHDRRFL